MEMDCILKKLGQRVQVFPCLKNRSKVIMFCSSFEEITRYRSPDVLGTLPARQEIFISYIGTVFNSAVRPSPGFFTLWTPEISGEELSVLSVFPDLYSH